MRRWWALVALLTAGDARAEGWLTSYTDYWDRILEDVETSDRYGVTSQLPQGIFTFKIDWNTREATGRYNNHRLKTEIAPPIVFGEVENPTLAIDLGAAGKGGGVTMQFSYGLTGNLDFYLELPFQYMQVQMRPKVRRMDPTAAFVINGFLPADYPRIDPAWLDEQGNVRPEAENDFAAWFVRYLPRLGRPSLGDPDHFPADLGPGKEYQTNGLKLADINCGFSWNFYRSSRWSGAITPRVFFPTGNIADPSNALTLGTGAELDRGVGAFGVGFTQGLDLRLYRYEYWIDVILSGEFTAAYRFNSKHRYPDFPKPTTDGNRLLDLLDPDRAYFPDMADLTGKSYTYIPGLSAGGTLTLGARSLIFDAAVSVSYSYSQEPELNADWRFERMVRNLEMQAAGQYELLRVSAGVTLIPFYIPLEIHYQYETPIGGRNVLVFGHNHWITVKGYLPTVF